MPPSTSPIRFPPLAETTETADAGLGLEALERFYRIHAHIYDWTRPFLLFGRGAAVRALEAGPGQRVLEVGCGTGWNLPRLARTGAAVVGIEPSPAMRAQASARLARRGLLASVRLDPRPYGVSPEPEGQADRILFSYSLSMIPPFAQVLERARRDLAPGGRIAVVDFLDAVGPVRAGLTASHVRLGSERLDLLRRLFPSHAVELRRFGFWRAFLFRGAVGPQGFAAAGSSRNSTLSARAYQFPWRPWARLSGSTRT
jgi:S-adenosylmethionine-diacylgycerolhomoserine-N-methlytransferase